MSDEGSGAALGLSAIRHALRTLDGRTRPTQLSQAVTKQFDHAIPNVIAWMDDAAPADYAAFAPLVMEYAEIGDEIALLIVRDAAQRSEEHTSELQSLMRISYAVFCLKKKKNTIIQTHMHRLT